MIGVSRRFYSIKAKSLFGSNGLNKTVKTKNKEQFESSEHVEADISKNVRTRFAPSPTGFLHLGSLRTALYNYLLAKANKGTFILRIEDTDQKRLVEGAKINILETMGLCNIEIDEGPTSVDGKERGEYGPYEQSKRSMIYRKYSDELLKSKKAYKCFCSKERLDKLTESAKNLKPPTTVSYDRHCYNLSEEKIHELEHTKKQPYVIRFKSPPHYPPFTDILHGEINLQPQINHMDVRYEDPVLVKSDGLPTYHFANVVDDHLMKISHVIRGEEWLPSTPKHIALYNAFGWSYPKFAHLPLLTSLSSDKKLSKRRKDGDVMTLIEEKNILPEALVNFSVLFGWAPLRKNHERSNEIYSMEDLKQIFSADALTKGNAKVDFKKLYYFNKHYLGERLQNDSQFKMEQTENISKKLAEKYGSGNAANFSKEKLDLILTNLQGNISTINELYDNDNENHHKFTYLFEPQNYDLASNVNAKQFIEDYFTAAAKKTNTVNILRVSRDYLEGMTAKTNYTNQIMKLFPKEQISKKDLFQVLRFGLCGSEPGITINVLINIFGKHDSIERIDRAIEFLEQINVEQG